MVDFDFQAMFPLAADTTPYRLLTTDHVSVSEHRGHRILEVDREALTLLAAESIRDISHLFRPGHLAQLRKILDDPEATDNVRALYGSRLAYAANAMDALDGADCLAIVTEWGNFRRPDFDEMARRMASRTIFDGRNLYDPREMKSRGFSYHAIGKAPV